MTISNTSFGQIVRADVNGHTISGQDADVMLSHLTGDMGDDLVIIFQFHSEHRIGQGVDDFAFK